MDFSTIVIITIVSTAFLYLLFLVIGVGGIAQNRKAQGVEEKSNK